MSFTGWGNGKFLRRSSAVVSAAPCTIACRYYLGAAPGGGIGIFGIYNSGASHDKNQISLRTNSAGNAILKLCDGTNNTNATATTTMSVGNWHSLVGVYASATSYTIYLNGQNAGSNTVSRIPSGLDRTSVGAQDDATPNLGAGATDLIADCSVWDFAFTAEQARQHALGIWPLYIAKPVAYWPLSGNVTPESDMIGGLAMTVQGSLSAGAHPPMARYGGQFIVPSLVHTPVNSGVLTQTLADFTISATGALLVQGALSVTLDDFTMTATDITQWAADSGASTAWTPAGGASTAWTPQSGAATTWTPAG